MATVEELEAQRAKLVAKIGAVKRAAHGDSDVTMRSIAEYEAALKLIDEQISRLSGKRRKRALKMQWGTD